MKVHEHNAGIDKENWKAEFALHLGQYANHERLHDVSFFVWAEHFIDALLKQERTRSNTSPNSQKVRAWAIVTKTGEFASDETRPNSLPIRRRKKQALDEVRNCVHVVIPITITYPLPHP